MPHFTLLSGEKISTPALSPALNAFLDRLRAGVEDVTVSEATFIELLYSVENPLLDQTIMPGRGTVTKAVFADPAYHVMLDLLGRKRLALGSLDMDKVRARYSMTVAQAAAHRGVHESAIRQAIQNRRLSSVRIDGRHMLDPEQVNALETSRRGPPAPLELVYGSIDGGSFSFKSDGDLVETGADGAKKTGRVERWTSAAILSSRKVPRDVDGPGVEATLDKARFWQLEPSAEVNEIQAGPFAVAGRFRVVDKTNNPRDARERFKSFQTDYQAQPGAGKPLVKVAKAAKEGPHVAVQRAKAKRGMDTSQR